MSSKLARLPVTNVDSNFRRKTDEPAIATALLPSLAGANAQVPAAQRKAERTGAPQNGVMFGKERANRTSRDGSRPSTMLEDLLGSRPNNSSGPHSPVRLIDAGRRTRIASDD